MLVPIQWLRDYVDIPADIHTFADQMTVSGTKVEAVESRDAGIKNVITAQVTAIERHPDSDHMWVCTMNDGTKQSTVVTGAQNVSLGDIVPHALNGSVVAEGKKIKTAKLRGVQSEGMLCSASELGIDASIAPKFAQDGIYILPDDTPLGADINEILSLNDTIIDFELTNNRQDCNSILGIAYEASATLGKEFQYPFYEYSSDGEEISQYLTVEVKNYDCANVIRHVW
jgi:phenylalanyl-tRNA synthetase beta chain